jgi:hypothetical protein
MFNALKQPLRFYSAKNKQSFERARKYYLYRPTIFCPTTRLIPFTLTRPKSTDNINVDLINIKTGDVTNIDSRVGADFIKDYTSDTDYLRYYGNSDFTALDKGCYYLHVYDGNNLDEYSERFGINDVDDMLQFEYSNGNDIAGFVYQTYQFNFKNRFWINAQIDDGWNEYEEFSQVVTKFNREQIPLYQKQAKIYRINAILNDWIVDAMRLMQLHDSVTITTPEGDSVNIRGNKITSINPDTIENTDYIQTEIKFKANITEIGTISEDNLVIESESRKLATEGSSILQTEDGEDILVQDSNL